VATNGLGHAFAGGILLLLIQPLLAAPSWQASLSKDPPGNFPSLRPLRAAYVFGWGGFTAATAEVQFVHPAPDRTLLQGTGHTTGFVRALWKYDVNYKAWANPSTLRPIETNQVDGYRSKKVTTHLTFAGSSVHRTRFDTPGQNPSKPRDFSFPDLYDLQTAMLYLRSQPLTDRSSYRVVVYPATNAYLATATILGREKISVRAGKYNAVKIDLQLKKIGKDFDLEPHKKFRRATVWISDDADRIILRIEAQVFVGTVFAELQSIRFDESEPKAPAEGEEDSGD
jgi:hypothetical protein